MKNNSPENFAAKAISDKYRKDMSEGRRLRPKAWSGKGKKTAKDLRRQKIAW